MKLLAVMSHKGGVGKTTSAVLLAEELAAKGYRTLLVDADRQQGAGLLLEVGPSTGDPQPTRMPGLDYLASGKFTDAEVAAKAPLVNERYDIGVVDTPPVDDDLARSWLQQATATLMIMQVEPLTVKTFPNALATLETVRRMNPLIELVGLLPTMFDATDATHRTCLTELLTRKPESVFTPPVPTDAGLMHRGAGSGAPQIGAAARQAYQCAADRIIRVVGPSRSGTASGGVAAAPSGFAAGQAAFPPAQGAAPGAWQPAPAAPAQFPAPQAQPGWTSAPAQAGFAPSAAPGGDAGYGYAAAASAPPTAFPEPAGQAPWQAQPAGFPPAAAPQFPAPAAAPASFPPAAFPAHAPPAQAGWPAQAAGPGGSAFDADERVPEWYQSDPGGAASAARPEARPARSGTPLPFLMGFAVACILALLVWALGSLRKPVTTPAHAAPPKVPAAAPAAPAGDASAVPKGPAAESGTQSGAAPRAAVRKEA